MNIFIEITANFILVLGFGILLQAPKKSLLFLGLTGTISWTAFLSTHQLTTNIIIATFIAALTVGLCGEFFARLQKLPSTIFIVAGILPLVPGVPAYQMMLYLINGQYLQGVEQAVTTLLIAGAISFGIAIVGGAAKAYSDYRQKTK